MAIVVSSSVYPTNPHEIFSTGFGLQTQTIIPSEEFQGTFNPEINTVEFIILDQNKFFQAEVSNFLDWTIDDNVNSDTNEFGGTNVINLDPVQNVINSGYDQGVLYAIYNFVNYELSSTFDNRYYISEISSDLTEIRIESNFITDSDIEYSYNIFKEQLEDADYFDEFYICFGENRNVIAVNCELDTAGDKFSILIKLFNPLPTDFGVQDECYITTKVAETQGYVVELFSDDEEFDDIDYIKGPNTNLEIQDFINNSTELMNKKQLTTATNNFTGSQHQLTNILNRKGVTIEPNYSFRTFDDFVHFSSAKSRINNFITKLKRIESYESDIETLNSITGNTLTVPSQSLGAVAADGKDLIITLQWNDIDPEMGGLAGVADALTGSITQNVTDATDGVYNPIYPLTNGLGSGAALSITVSAQSVLNITAIQTGSGYLTEASNSLHVSTSIATLADKITTEIKNMDGYEYYLYYNTSSLSYPKEGVGVTGYSFPYAPTASTSDDALKWLGSDVTSNQYYGGILLSASRYDEDNKDWLFYTVPDYIKENNANDNYIDFVNMIGQHFDEIWLYTRAVTAKLNSTNVLDKGVPIQLADDVITSLGYTGLTNQYNNQDNFIGLVGENNREYCPPTGSEKILEYICINKGEIQNYWAQYYSWEDYVEQLITPGWPYPIDRVSKEIFKRLYHNMSYLVKTKGTPAGLRQLINIWGIPNTILRINEFGGKNRDNTNDYDLWYNRYSYAYKPISTQNVASSSIVIPWAPMQLNQKQTGNPKETPDGLQFRFKTTGYPSSSAEGVGDYFSQSLLVKIAEPDKDTRELMSASGELNVPISASGEFGIALYYTGSTSGSYSGSQYSKYRDWGIMQFYISASVAEGGVARSEPIYLPFFNKGWWSVQLQRGLKDNNPFNKNYYYLNVAQKIYNGNDGNQIGWTGSAMIDAGLNGNVSQSINNSWMSYTTTTAGGIYLGGLISGSKVGPVTMSEQGKVFSGSLQEFRYFTQPYTNTKGQMTEDHLQKFYDYVMNPESIEGLEFSGSKDSYNMIAFRAPLGNELEHFYTSSGFPTTNEYNGYTESISSVHPAVSCSTATDFTSSFLMSLTVSSSDYHVIYYGNTSTRTFSETNKETYFLDQPIIGVRNRVNNKIQVDNDDPYGKVLSNQRSIRQDYQISKSYTEDINNAEAGFSYQNEINDDIIASLGYGSVEDRIADPRLLFSTSGSTQADTFYYPNLRVLAKNYFRKYHEGNIVDYMRLIKYFDNSVFKAIKNWAPARTGMSTGIIVKQHMLERNRIPEPIVTLNENVAAVDQSPWNTYEVMQDLVNSGSILAVGLTGSAAGSVNKYNKINYLFSASNTSTPTLLESGSIRNLFSANFPFGSPTSSKDNVFDFGLYAGGWNFTNNKKRDITAHYNIAISQSKYGFGNCTFELYYSSSIHGVSTLGTAQGPSGSAYSFFDTNMTNTPITVQPRETFEFQIKSLTSDLGYANYDAPPADWLAALNNNSTDATPSQVYANQNLTAVPGIRFKHNLVPSSTPNAEGIPDGDQITNPPITPSGVSYVGIPAIMYDTQSPNTGGVYFKVSFGADGSVISLLIDENSAYTNNGYGGFQVGDKLRFAGLSIGGGTGGYFEITLREEDFTGALYNELSSLYSVTAYWNFSVDAGGSVDSFDSYGFPFMGVGWEEGDQVLIPTSLIGGTTDIYVTLTEDLIKLPFLNPISFVKFSPNGYIAYGGDAGGGGTSDVYTTGSIPKFDTSQAWYYANETPTGLVEGWDAEEEEFFNGEFSGSEFNVTQTSLNGNNPFLTNFGDQDLSYYVYVYSGSMSTQASFLLDKGNADPSLVTPNDMGIIQAFRGPTSPPVSYYNFGVDNLSGTTWWPNTPTPEYGDGGVNWEEYPYTV